MYGVWCGTGTVFPLTAKQCGSFRQEYFLSHMGFSGRIHEFSSSSSPRPYCYCGSILLRNLWFHDPYEASLSLFSLLLETVLLLRL